MRSASAELVSYRGWEECIRLANDHVELVAPTTVGPRIVSFGFLDGPNEFHQIEADLGRRGDAEYRYYGGHRLWYAPEVAARTTIPDNDPLEYDVGDGRCRLVQPVEPETGIQKELRVDMAADEPAVTVSHRLTNEGGWPVELAPWGITLLRGGGTGFLPATGRGGDARRPDRELVYWPYTRLGDNRITTRDGHVRVEQDPNGDGECKIGTTGRDGWLAYVNDGRAFWKSYEFEPNATYPDRGCAAEIYTDDAMQELETLGPLTELEPGETVEHVETWRLYDDVPDPEAASLGAFPFA